MEDSSHLRKEEEEDQEEKPLLGSKKQGTTKEEADELLKKMKFISGLISDVLIMIYIPFLGSHYFLKTRVYLLGMLPCAVRNSHLHHLRT